jgi:alkanesulfonate monooxygenase SsuD/methylene tetrahydromethanopterin reductase-like flavin-dependent oxidoreductase (luciferase family)
MPGSEVSFSEQLTWITRGARTGFDEIRTHRFHGLDVARGLWALDFTTTLRDVSGRGLELGSPTRSPSCGPRDLGPEGAVYAGSPETVARKIAGTIRTLGLDRFDLTFSARSHTRT